jgi:hypothetical protein
MADLTPEELVERAERDLRGAQAARDAIKRRIEVIEPERMKTLRDMLEKLERGVADCHVALGHARAELIRSKSKGAENAGTDSKKD